jgi:hypothetical protein
MQMQLIMVRHCTALYQCIRRNANGGVVGTNDKTIMNDSTSNSSFCPL